MRKRIRQILFDLGIPFKLNGFKYLEDALVCIIEVDEKSFIKVCEYVGEEYFGSRERIYGAISVAVKKADRNSDAWKKYVKLDITSPTDIVYALAFNIMKEIEDEQDISARDCK